MRQTKETGHNCEAAMATLRGEVMTHIATLTGQVGIALTGVGNFKKFQEEDFPALKGSVEAFHTEMRTRDAEKVKTEEKDRATIAMTLKSHNQRVNRSITIAGIAVGALISVLVAGMTIREEHHDADVQVQTQQTVQKTVDKSVKSAFGIDK